MRAFRAFLGIFCVLGGTAAAEPLPLESLYQAGQFEEAIQQLLSAQKETDLSSKPGFAFYYNLGTLYFKLGKAGLATAYLEKAHLLNPLDPDIRLNRDLAQTGLSRLLGGEDKLDPAAPWILSWAESLPWTEICGVLGLACLLCTLLWARNYATHRNPRILFSQTSGAFSLVFLLLMTACLILEQYAKTASVGVSLQTQSIRSGPGENYSELTRIEAGVKLRLFEASFQQSGDVWRQIRYSQEGVGWVRESSLLLL